MKNLVVYDTAYWCTVAEHTDEWGTCPSGYLIASTSKALDDKVAEMMQHAGPAEYPVFGAAMVGLIKEDVATRLKSSNEKCIWVTLTDTPFLQ